MSSMAVINLCTSN